MYQETTLELLHQSYQVALSKSSNILEIVENLYAILSEAEVAPTDSQKFDSFLDGLRACLHYRRKTFIITNEVIYINITLMYIMHWLNNTKGMKIDIDLSSRRKSLESDLTKMLLKSDSHLSVNIRDRFGLRGILLNDFSAEKSKEYIYTIFDAIVGILAGKNRKMKKEFIQWYKDNPYIPLSDQVTIKHVLDIPFSVDCVKDYIKDPKPNGYQSLQFTMSIQMYSDILPGCQLEIQLRSNEMHKDAVYGNSAHDKYKLGDVEDEHLREIQKVFTVDDFSKLKITGFSGYSCAEEDHDGIHFAKVFCNRRISTKLVRF